MLTRLIQSGVLIALFTGTAAAQLGNTGNTGNVAPTGGMQIDNRRILTPDEQRREREIESQYNTVIHDRIPDKKGAGDPWGNVRSTPAKSAR
jgi:hypothetical protein